VAYRHEETIRLNSVRARATAKKRSTLARSATSLLPMITAAEFDRLADLPVDLLRAIDREARRIGVTRQAFIKLRMSDTLVNT